MQVVHSQSVTANEIMDAVLACAKDKSLLVAARKEYYAEYLRLSANYLKMQRVTNTN